MKILITGANGFLDFAQGQALGRTQIREKPAELAGTASEFL